MTRNEQESPANLADLVETLRSGQREDPVCHLLALTFEFDDAQLLKLACLYPLTEDYELGRGAMRRLLELRPLVFYDASKTRECANLPQFLELYPCRVTGFACHHSKAYLAITEKTVRLLLGSFNLTRTGLFQNREVLDSFLWSATQARHGDLLRQWVAFLRAGYGHRAQASSQSALQTILDDLEHRCAVWPLTDDNEVQLLPSGYGEESGLDRLEAVWRRWYPRRQPSHLLVVSPFFDRNPDSGCLAQDVAKRFPSVRHCSLITEENALPLLSRAHFEPWADGHLYLAPAVPPQEEQRRIALAAQERIRTEDMVLSRRLHAKIWLLWRGTEGLVYVGSANFTRKAWQKGNQELGVVRRVNNAAAVRDSIMGNLYAKQKTRFSTLPAEPLAAEAVAEDEAYAPSPPYPSGIACVLLDRCADPQPTDGATGTGPNAVCFTLIPSEESPPFSPAEWCVDWDGLPLVFQNGKSQRIEGEYWVARLLRRRNLGFRLKTGPGSIYWMPFQYAPSLVEERHALYAPATLDWLLMHLEPACDDCEPLGGSEAGAGPESGVATEDAGRSRNPIVSMQTYLTVYQRFERQLEQRIAEAAALESILNSTVTRDKKLHRAVVEPLNTLFVLLTRESRLSDADAVAVCFKLGELALTVHRFAVQNGIGACLAELRARLTAALGACRTAAGRLSDMDAYCGFVLHQMDAPASPRPRRADSVRPASQRSGRHTA